MDWFSLVVLGHIIGVVFGVGGATVSDALFLRSIKDRRISSDELNLLSQASKVIWSGLAILILSGTGFILFQYFNTGAIAYFSYPYFQAKMTLVGVIILNGVVFHRFVFPLMKKNSGDSLQNKEIASKLWLFATTGGISIISWYGALTLGVLKPAYLSYLMIINIYIVLVLFAILSGYLMLSRDVFSQRTRKEKDERPRHKRRHYRKAFSIVLTVVVILGAAFGLAVVFYPEPAVHEICITEESPWVSLGVLEIEVGDTVIWKICDSQESLPALSFVLPSVSAHGGVDHGEESSDHFEHSILALSGPEIFSSVSGWDGQLKEGEVFIHTFTQEGIYTYICEDHPYEKGVIAVGQKYDEVKNESE